MSDCSERGHVLARQVLALRYARNSVGCRIVFNQLSQSIAQFPSDAGLLFHNIVFRIMIRKSITSAVNSFPISLNCSKMSLLIDG